MTTTKANGTRFTHYGFANDGTGTLRAIKTHYVKVDGGSRSAGWEWGTETFKTAKQAQAWSLEQNLAEHARVCGGAL